MIPLEKSKIRGSHICVNCGELNGNRARRCRSQVCSANAIRKTVVTPEPHDSIDSNDALLTNILSNLDGNNSNLSFSDAFVNNMVGRLQSESAFIPTPSRNVKVKPSAQKASPRVDKCEGDSNPINNLSFLQWVSSATERINQTMHFSFSGKPDPLVFHIPENFFEDLHKRMSVDKATTATDKRRLPDKTCVFERRGSPPLGWFTMYTWHFHSFSTLTQIFNTDQIQLQIIKYYEVAPDGSYVETNSSSLQDITIYQPEAGVSAHKIAPGRLLTFLKVGKKAHNPTSEVPFTIEWIPNILPLSRVGELRIKLEFGHKSK